MRTMRRWCGASMGGYRISQGQEWQDDRQVWIGKYLIIIIWIGGTDE